MRKNDNVILAKELIAVAKELVAATQFDIARNFQKAVSKPTQQNINKFTKSLAPSKSKTGDEDDDVAAITKDLAEIAQEMLDSDDEDEKEEDDEI